MFSVSSKYLFVCLVFGVFIRNQVKVVGRFQIHEFFKSQLNAMIVSKLLFLNDTRGITEAILSN